MRSIPWLGWTAALLLWAAAAQGQDIQLVLDPADGQVNANEEVIVTVKANFGAVTATAFEALVDFGSLTVVGGADGVGYGSAWDVSLPPTIVGTQLVLTASSKSGGAGGEATLASFAVKSSTSGTFKLQVVRQPNNVRALKADNTVIAFATYGSATVQVMSLGEPDTLDDAWEMQWFGSLDQTDAGDFDGDGFTNKQEYDAQSNPARSDRSPIHSLDTGKDNKIGLLELNRAVTLYNAKAYHIDLSTPDKFAPGTGSHDGHVPHNSDYNPQDWVVGLLELNRAVTLYQASKPATGGYTASTTTQDGFAPKLTKSISEMLLELLTPPTNPQQEGSENAPADAEGQ